jgi:hypothetical protein
MDNDSSRLTGKRSYFSADISLSRGEFDLESSLFPLPPQCGNDSNLLFIALRLRKLYVIKIGFHLQVHGDTVKRMENHSGVFWLLQFVISNSDPRSALRAKSLTHPQGIKEESDPILDGAE